MQEYLELLKRLIRLRPVSADIEAVNRVTETLYDFMAVRGLYCTLEKLNERKILFVSTAPGKKPDLLLNAHVDVVPATDETQYELKTEDGWLFGRGTGDCLGNVVCIVKTLCEVDRKLSVGTVFSSDEEIGGQTTARMVELGYSAGRMICILDSWENDSICHAQKGILVLKLTAHGRGGHASHPWDFDNPIDQLLEAYSRLKTVWKNPVPTDSWHKSMAASVISAGVAVNQIPETAEMILNIRYTEVQEKDEILDLVKEKTGLQITALENCPPVFVPNTAPEFRILENIMRKVLKKQSEYSRMNGATDARWFASLNKPIAIIGIESAGIHGQTEKANLGSIVQYAEIMKCLAGFPEQE